MNIRTMLVLAGTVVAGAAHAQLIFGHTQYSSSAPGTSGAYYLDVQTGTATQLWTGASNKKVTGLAADNAGKTIWGADNARLYEWGFGQVGTPPTFINGFYRLGSNGSVYATFVGSLGFGNNTLYAYTNYNAGGSALYVEDGIYSIDTSITTSGTPNMSLLWKHNDLEYNFEGFEYNADDGLFYATNNPTDASMKGLYTIDALGTGAVTKIADYDPFLMSPDGLAIGGGHIWMTGKITGETALKIVGYNLSTGLYDEAFSLDGLATNARFTGATWAPDALVPEPATLAALGVGVVALIRRRKR